MNHLLITFLICSSLAAQSSLVAAANLRGDVFGANDQENLESASTSIFTISEVIEHDTVNQGDIRELASYKENKKDQIEREERTRQKQVTNEKNRVKREEKTRQKQVTNEKNRVKREDSTRLKRVSNKKKRIRREEKTMWKRAANKKDRIRREEKTMEKRAGNKKDATKKLFN